MSVPFKSYERPKNLLIVTDDFTVQNGMLTPSLKVKRRAVVGKYEAQIMSLY
jgi:long-chain acyl-CoA synthetase